jgi:ribonuclease I
MGTFNLKHAIEQVNPALNDSEIALTCAGSYLKEVELCVTKDGKPQPCSGVNECRGASLRVPAIR